MEYIYIGDIVNTHGLKGELRILSDFEQKEFVFVKDKTLYIGKNKNPKKVLSYRKHKKYDMVVFEGIDSIDEAILWKGEQVFIKRKDISYNGILLEDLLGFDVSMENRNLGKIKSIMKSKAHPILVVGDEEILIPYVDAFVKKIDDEKKEIQIHSMKGICHED